MPAPDYEAWPLAADVSAVLAASGIVVRADVDDDHIEAKVAAVAARIRHVTHREFVAVQDDRYFDGNDSGELEIDEFTELGTVSQIGMLAGGSPMTMANVVPVTQATFPQSRIQIYRGSYPSYAGLYIDRFPAGRSNILVADTTWGYADEIPADLWEASRNMAAALLAIEAVSEAGRFLTSWTEEGVSERYVDKLPGEALGWSQMFEQVMREYRKPARRNVKRMTAPLI